MPSPQKPPAPTPPTPHKLGFDLDALRAKYRAERDRRIRPDGSSQYRRLTGELSSYADDPYAELELTREPLCDRVDVAVIGGGFGGLLTGARLRQAGIQNIRMIEQAADFGGTWYWNRYPGVHCDIESYVYMPLLEELGYIPKWKYAPGEEIRQHARAIGRHFDLYRDALFRTRASELRWNEAESEWIVSTDRGDRMRARHVVVSSGTLSLPKLPGIPGIETFEGHTFHTSRWDYAYTGGDANGNLDRLADKRVAVIGTGATAIQIVPHLGRDARHLYVFQRTPSSVDVRANRPTDPEWATSLKPGWQQRRRDNFLTLISGGQAEQDLVRDGWTSSARLLQNLLPTNDYDHIPAEERERVGELADFQKMNELRARVDALVDDPATAEALKPWYRYMCKRPTFSDTYLETFNRPNVTLVDTADHGGVERITESGLVVGDTEYEVDCIIFATGFEVGASGILSGELTVYGRDGVTFPERWKDGPRTLHGLSTHGFPNLFQLSPLQNASASNFVHILDEQATHIAAILAAASKRQAAYVEPSADAEAAWVATIHEKAPQLHKFQAECTPGYYNNEGMPRKRVETFGDGAIAFHELLRRWRTEGGMDEVLVE
ncbi:NAD(P)/FAD-dependent oxidoreductase [Streptomyces sp. NPDC050619]|uniref:flavin-containing monooxygenase n=1 Tax=Streptomyces sp. NPDC050619 TaxID=3157214 RepID=UPI003419659E